jgi:hypothetical protein
MLGYRVPTAVKTSFLELAVKPIGGVQVLVKMYVYIITNDIIIIIIIVIIIFIIIENSEYKALKLLLLMCVCVSAFYMDIALHQKRKKKDIMFLKTLLVHLFDTTPKMITQSKIEYNHGRACHKPSSHTGDGRENSQLACWTVFTNTTTTTTY